MANELQQMTPAELEEFQRRRRRRSIALALVLAALVIIFYAVTVVRLGPDVLNRPL